LSVLTHAGAFSLQIHLERMVEPLQVIPIHTPRIEQRQALLPVLLTALPGALQSGDVLCVASKVVALEQGRLIRLADVQPSARARRLAHLKLDMDPDDQACFAELVLQEAEVLFESDNEYAFLTLKDGMLVANAGVDLSNVPAGHSFRTTLEQHFEVENLGVVLTDSRLTPLRRGVTGVALAYSGFEGMESQKGKPDLFGRPLRFTEKASADSMAAAAVLLGGEGGEGIPFVLVRGAPLVYTRERYDALDPVIDPKVDLFSALLDLKP
jgi:coenzyme F420-0:L-glutamate ligase/coenzyme F420-1:gamma-L-glutamate ligase